MESGILSEATAGLGIFTDSKNNMIIIMILLQGHVSAIQKQKQRYVGVFAFQTTLDEHPDLCKTTSEQTS